MRPASPKEVVELAGRHLGLERAFVVARAVDLEPDQERRREPAQLQALWKDLVAHATNTVSTGEVDGASEAEAPPALDGPTEAEAPPELDAPPEAEAVDGFDLADLDDLAEAPSHAHDIEEKIKATFPGTELTLLPEPDGDNAGGET